MDIQFPVAADDFRHPLQEGEHEAFYFVFSAPDQQVFGFLRTLFGHDDVLELVALHFGGRTWAYRQRTPLSGKYSLPGDASGPALTMACRQPWHDWRCRFRANMQAVEETIEEAVEIDLTFAASNTPALYRLGPYQQAEQEGWMSGYVQVGEERWAGQCLCYRDRSWGRRTLEIPAAGWIVACVPDRLYVVAIEIGDQTIGWGRVTSPEGAFRPIHAPVVTAGDTWRIRDPQADLDTWQARRQVPPIVAQLGLAGQEAIRNTPQAGDLYRDETGPAIFTSPQGEELVGFVEYARRIA